MEPGTRLGPYEILEQLGAGGMGVVWRARDPRLERDVAIKLLPADLAADGERLARFEREAKLLAQLSHPNIAGIHGLEEADGSRFIVMECVEGRTLAEKLRTEGRIQVLEAVELAREIAEALEAAHEAGIIHRDLKPANIKITPGEQVKVLDFGLAKGFEGSTAAGTSTDLSQSPTVGVATRSGMILGTAAYMSPEQARGKPVDARTDIWAFGCVLYEMLSGGRLFAEPTVSDTLAAVLRAEIDWKRLPRDTPEHLRHLLRRCLERDRRQRLHAIADARIELRPPAGELQPAVSTTGASPGWGKLVSATLLGGVVTGSALLLSGYPVVRHTEQPLRVLEIVQGIGVDPYSVQWGMNVSEPRVSPDGSMLAYPHEGRIWIRGMGRREPRPLEGTDGARDAFWSPDSGALAYVAGAELRRVDAEGGASILLARLDGAYLGGTWGVGDRIVVGLGGRGLLELSGRGGEPRVLLPAAAEQGDFDFHSPIFIDDRGAIAFILHEQVGYKRRVQVFDGGEPRDLLSAPTGALLTSLAVDSSARQLVFATIRSNAGLWAAPFDGDGGASEVQPQLLIPHGLAPSVAADGTLVYVEGLRVEPARFARVDRAGAMLGEVGQALWDMDRPVTSPDGSLVAAIATDGGSREVWVHELERDTAIRVTSDPPENITVGWADGGESVVYATSSGGTSRLVKQRADGGGDPTVLVEGQVGRPSLPRDGSFLVYQVGGTRLRRGPGDLWWVPIAEPDAAAPLVATPADEVQPAVSPDGTLLAYASDESGRYEVYLRPLAGEGRRLRVSAQGGEAPLWSRDGGELYYVEDSALMAIRVDAQGQSLGSPELLFTGEDVHGSLVQNGIVSLALGPAEDFLVVRHRLPGTPTVVAVQSWSRLLERRE